MGRICHVFYDDCDDDNNDYADDDDDDYDDDDDENMAGLSSGQSKSWSYSSYKTTPSS